MPIFGDQVIREEIVKMGPLVIGPNATRLGCFTAGRGKTPGVQAERDDAGGDEEEATCSAHREAAEQQPRPAP